MTSVSGECLLDAAAEMQSDPSAKGVSNQNLLLYKSKNSNVPIYVSGVKSQNEIDGGDLLTKIKTFLDQDSDINKEFARKMEQLQRRYQHAVKSELVNFCYASSLSSFDTNEPFPRLPAQRSSDFVSTLLNIVEKDKEIAEIATALIEDIESIENAKYRMNQHQNGEAEVFKTILRNSRKSTQQIVRLLDEERKEIFGARVKETKSQVEVAESFPNMQIQPPQSKDSTTASPAWPAHPLNFFNESKETVSEDAKVVMVRGISNIMKRLGHEQRPDEDVQETLKKMKEALGMLNKEIVSLRERQTDISITGVEERQI